MYAITKGDITIREMMLSDISPYLNLVPLDRFEKFRMLNQLRVNINNKNEESDLTFSILYGGKVVGVIILEFKGYYKSDGDMTMYFPNPNYVQVKKKVNGNLVTYNLAAEVGKLFIDYCKEIGIVDVLGVPKAVKNGLIHLPMQILPSSKV